MEIHSLPILYYITFLSLFYREFSWAIDTLTPSQQITDNTSLISAHGKFQLGFFSPGNSRNKFLGICFKNIPNKTVIWVANRETPLNDSNGILQIGNDGNLILRHGNGRIAWSSNISNVQSNTVAQILDSGNLVLREERNENPGLFLWQSFDHPSDTMVAGMKLGLDLEIGMNRFLTSWKNKDDPSNGLFTHSFDLHGLPQIVMREGTSMRFRSGIWDGSQFSGSVLSSNLAFNQTVVMNSKEAYYEYNLYNESTITMVVLSYMGSIQRVVWDDNTFEWRVTHLLPRDRCDNYGECGFNAICTITDLRLCRCLDGYIPNSTRDWDMFIQTGGCVRRKPLNCPNGEGFIEVVGVKIPDLVHFRIEPAFTLDECKVECLKNCSCTSYANLNARNESGCLMWFNDLVDIRMVQDLNTKFYLRVTASELPSGGPSSKSKNKRTVLMVVMIAGSIALLVSVASIIIWKKRLQLCIRSENQVTDEENPELSVFSMETLAKATCNFSCSNKIGEGGFGPVYKGLLSSGIEIAVKRLSLTSGQGVTEFKNEVTLMSKLQHRNLVRLLGCCIHGDERMLVYEYMPSGSLNSVIFDDAKSNFLGWSRRYDIIIGIARGLLYLHRDSRLRIIHRDLKGSNVLLDSDMNPKISDFGTARAFVGADQNLAKTKTVIGTYGYMSPEYAIDGIFSMKSDVFSFGVLVLEIVSGKRNRQFHHPDHDLSLLGHAWQLWTEEKAFELLDPQLVDMVSLSEVVKCIQVALLCVQHRPKDRPTMSSVVLLLDSASAILPQPNHPGFYMERNSVEDQGKQEFDGRTLVTNVLTDTLSEGR